MFAKVRKDEAGRRGMGVSDLPLCLQCIKLTITLLICMQFGKGKGVHSPYWTPRFIGAFLVWANDCCLVGSDVSQRYKASAQLCVCNRLSICSSTVGKPLPSASISHTSEIEEGESKQLKNTICSDTLRISPSLNGFYHRVSGKFPEYHLEMTSHPPITPPYSCIALNIFTHFQAQYWHS